MSSMDKKHAKIDHLESDERKEELREAVISADATGLIAGEELITQAETMLPISSQEQRK
ncbi:MAG TPA: hypothetical protein VMW12_10540 [Candidatus Dormibacteraeota bacterium]|nr:hypothetical protein [Candidatus Dormibacteraeota bacterium]